MNVERFQSPLNYTPLRAFGSLEKNQRESVIVDAEHKKSLSPPKNKYQPAALSGTMQPPPKLFTKVRNNTVSAVRSQHTKINSGAFQMSPGSRRVKFESDFTQESPEVVRTLQNHSLLNQKTHDQIQADYLDQVEEESLKR